MRWRRLRWLFGVLLFCVAAPPAAAQPEVGLKLDLISIRNRQMAPVPVRVRLEYNHPQILEGTLELQIFDAQGYIEDSDLVTTIVRDGIVLSGRDYEFNMLLPPMRVATRQNFAVRAWFVTKDDRIPLTSIRGRLNPPEAFDLIMPMANQRGLIVCSICESPAVSNTSPPDRALLENLLTMSEWNAEQAAPVEPISQNGDVGGVPPESAAPPEKSLVHYAAALDSSEISEDPLWLCGFDVLLMSDRGLSGLSVEQLAGVRTWVRGGGSLCVHAAEVLQSQHLNFLRELTGFGEGRAGDLALDADGRLLLLADDPSQPILAEAGLGRVALLPVSTPLSEQLGSYEQQGRLLKFLWRIRSDLPMSDPETFRRQMRLRRLETAFSADTELEWDGATYRVASGSGMPIGDSQYRYGYGNGVKDIDSDMAKEFLSFTRLQPTTDRSVDLLEQLLLPATLKLVPTPMMFLILFGYILMIGPIDYFVLGWLKARKYTWITFPIVTVAFTLLTMGVARYYMGDQNTMNTLTVTDLGEGREPLRQTQVSTIFYSGYDMLALPQRNQSMVQLGDFLSTDQNRYGAEGRTTNDAPVYNSVFPSSWTFVQPVRQWSPVTLRSMTFSPDPQQTVVPELPWDDASLLTTQEGRGSLTAILRQLSQKTGHRHAAMVLRAGRLIGSVGLNGGSAQMVNGYEDELRYGGRTRTQDQLFDAAIRSIPTQRPHQASNDEKPSGYFNIFSGISPHGSGTLEDLVISDSTDSQEFVLVVIRTTGQNVEVFRRRHRVVERSM